ncbi:tRNA synthetases class I (W and Y) [Musa troglodytarum]|uniref:tyrosine--tRNA ligase n=1 Tax=Musa troglodytarum TaxID=320322 RepID=A0A9E7F9E3_9LILI|nr:tRNA synthetases class I (W and Y) [Musa troglodytarum]
MMAGPPVAADPSPDVGTASRCFALGASAFRGAEGEPMNLLEKKTVPVCCDGFEPSGTMHIAQADICHLGMDQRKVNVLAREYCDDIKRKKKQAQHFTCFLDCRRDMRKCQKAEVNVKIKKGYCPPKIVEGNPCLEYIKHIVFPWCGYFGVMRQVENGGTKMYNNMEELILDYESGALHPADLKPALPKALNVILQVGLSMYLYDLQPELVL